MRAKIGKNILTQKKTSTYIYMGPLELLHEKSLLVTKFEFQRFLCPKISCFTPCKIFCYTRWKMKCPIHKGTARKENCDHNHCMYRSGNLFSISLENKLRFMDHCCNARSCSCFQIHRETNILKLTGNHIKLSNTIL